MKRFISLDIMSLLVLLFGIAVTEPSLASCDAKDVSLLNVSYDPTRELFERFNQAFAKHWSVEHDGQIVTVRQSHGGSGKQARSVIDGLEADVVTLALSYDIDQIAKSGLISANWQDEFPSRSAPYTSTIVFLVRKGNPLQIHDWEDLARKGIAVVTPNPKTSGGARWNYLAAWGYALKKFDNDQSKAKEFVRKIYANVPVLDTGARGSTTTFIQRGIGDVLISWENEALLAVQEVQGAEVEIVIPSMSILAEPSVAVVDSVVKKHGTEEVAKAYVQYLYSAEGQRIIAENHYRPLQPVSGVEFSKIDLFKIEEIFGGWTKAQSTHFDDGGTFDQIYTVN